MDSDFEIRRLALQTALEQLNRFGSPYQADELIRIAAFYENYLRHGATPLAQAA